MKRLLAISDHLDTGGAAIACGRILEAVSQCDPTLEISRIVQYAPEEPHPHTWRLSPHLTLQTWARRLKPLGLGAFLEQATSRNLLDRFHRLLNQLQPDLINIHNIHGASNWGLELIEAALEHAPVVWTLHDMWSFTGGCAYSFECERFRTHCDSSCTCPPQSCKPEDMLLAASWEHRRRLFQHPNLYAVSPSHWLAQCATNDNGWPRERLSTIANPIDLDQYSPSLREHGREDLKLATGQTSALIVSEYLHQPRKGGHLIHEALRAITTPLTLLTMGNAPAKIENSNIHCKHLGYIADEATKARIFAAVDLLIHPAPVDNLPCVISEANACGTPIVGFPIGGVKEMVREGETGWLADELSAPSLTKAIRRALDDIAAGKTLRQSARAYACEAYNPQQLGQAYLSTFHQVLEASA
ncbi:MAG: glycosyltransferase [Puniceicoccales bacterium]